MAEGYLTDTVAKIETNLDDLSPEMLGYAMDKLLSSGALDVYFTPIQMKKNRPAVQLSVLCEPAQTERFAGIIFAETSALGVRVETLMRLKLERLFRVVTTEFGEITVKLGLKAGEVVQVSPEFESCRVAAENSGQPLAAIYEAASRAYWQSTAAV